MKGVLALKPNSWCALVVSSMRRGWPSGLVVSQKMLPLKFIKSTSKETKSFIEISKPAPIFTGSDLSYLSVARIIASAASST